MTGRDPIGKAAARLGHARLVAVVTLASSVIAGSAFADDPRRHHCWFGQLEFHASILSDLGDRKIEGTTFGPAAKLGYRWDRWGVFVSLEQNAWVTTEAGETGLRAGALNIGLGAELMYAYGLLRASLALGPSILLYESALDPAGTTGFYMDLRPAGIRWHLTEWFALMFDPVSFALVAPVLTGIPLLFVEYRTTLTTEFRW